MTGESAVSPATGGRYRAVTISDVAREAAVAKSTVSRALNKPGRLNTATQERIRQVADRLGYFPNPAARALGTRRTDTLALLVPDMSNPYFLGIIRGAERQAADAGYNLILSDSENDPDREAGTFSKLAKSVDGFVVGYIQLPQSRVRAAAAEHSLVVLNRRVTGLSSVIVDTVRGPTMAVDHLASLGHREIAYVAGPDVSWTSARRWSAVRSAATARGITVQRLGPFAATQASGAAAADAAVTCGASAVIAFNDLIAIGMLRRLGERGVRVPGDLSIVGFDDIFGASFCSPSLTTLAAPLDEVGRAAVKLLLDRLGDATARPRRLTLPAQLIVRDSTGPRSTPRPARRTSPPDLVSSAR